LLTARGERGVNREEKWRKERQGDAMEKAVSDRESNRPHEVCGLLLKVHYYLQF
jgi:hypothetical protein